MTTRRDFLKGGSVLAACLVLGLKPKAPEPKFERVGQAANAHSHWIEIGTEPWQALYGGAAGGGKTPYVDDDFIYGSGGYLVPEVFTADLLRAAQEPGWLAVRRVTFDLEAEGPITSA